MGRTSMLLAAAVLLALATATAAAPDDTTTGNITRHIPDCARPCLDLALQNATCSPTDLDCLCGIAWPSPVLRACSITSCDTVADVLATINGTATGCNVPYTRQSPALLQTTVVFCSIGIACVLVRLYAPVSSRRGWLQRVDHWMMVGNAILLSTMIVCTVLAHNIGYGQDTWAIPPSQSRTIMILVYSLEIQYTFIVHLTKLSILYFYVQFFPAGFFPKLRRVFSVTAAATVVSCISFSMAFIFQCIPVNFLWDAFSEDVPLDVRASGHCINTYAFGLAASSINLAFDLWLLVLPMPELYRLSLPRSKKLAVCAMFAMGSFVNIITIPRILYVQYFKDSSNPVHDLWWISLWAHIEATSSVIVACMPGIYCAAVRVYRRSLGLPSTTTRTTTSRTATELGTARYLSSVRPADEELASSTQLTDWRAAVADKAVDGGGSGERRVGDSASSVATGETVSVVITRAGSESRDGLN